ncbi:MAG TPA: hypothetical protein VLG69_04060 [Candidatus Andersenbacteria bacterium]|nr:hypothetical protein [Candidatus Andersenbacteria bacterium]
MAAAQGTQIRFSAQAQAILRGLQRRLMVDDIDKLPKLLDALIAAAEVRMGTPDFQTTVEMLKRT